MNYLKYLALLALLLGRWAGAAPLDIYVLPYYFSDGQQIRVGAEVGPALQPLLAAGSTKDLAAARAQVEADAARVASPALMVLAVRLYDAGQRDEAAFWFYVAQLRYRLFGLVINRSRADLWAERMAMSAFNEQAGRYLHSYALCDMERWPKLRTAALDWVLTHPEAALNDPSLPGLAADRPALLERARAQLKLAFDRDNQHLLNPTNRQRLRAQFQRQGLDKLLCSP